MNNDVWLRIEGENTVVEDPEALGKWLELAESEEVWVPAAHVEGYNGDFKVERSEYIEQLPVSYDDNLTETEL